MPKPNISSGRTRITTTIHSPLLTSAKMLAASQNVPLNVVIEAALNEYFENEQTDTMRKIKKMLADV